MIDYKGVQTFKFAEVEDSGCEVVITIDFDNKEITTDGRGLKERIKDAVKANFHTYMLQVYDDYIAVFIRHLAQIVGEQSANGDVKEYLSKHVSFGDWITDPKFGVSFRYVPWNPELELALQECPYKEERPWKEW